MCVIVYKPKGVDIDMEKLQLCWEHNKDGAGLMFAEDGVLRVAKGFMKWRSLKRYIRRSGMERLNALPIVFHFRIATHGTVGPRNCHPFQMNDNLAMAHNGVMSNVDIPDGEDISDSEAFLQRYVRDAFSSISIGALSKGMPINELFSKFIGGSKLVFMDNDGDVAIVNEMAGTWQDGVWHSNMLWKPYVRSTTPISKSKTPTSPLYGTGNAGYGTGIGPRMNVTQLERSTKGAESKLEGGSWKEALTKSIEDLDDWYCFSCHCYFALGDARRTYWTNNMKDRIVDCPECSGPNTVEVGDDMLDDTYDDSNVSGWSVQWRCYDCDETFDEDSTVMNVIDGEERCKCPFCESTRTYESEWQDVVDRLGPIFFVASTYDLTKGGVDA